MAKLIYKLNGTSINIVSEKFFELDKVFLKLNGQIGKLVRRAGEKIFKKESNEKEAAEIYLFS